MSTTRICKGACEPWPGRRDRFGYGRVRRAGHDVQAHRIVLERAIGRPLGPREYALHRCDNPPCVKRAHLFVGSSADNNRDTVAKGRHRSGVTFRNLTPSERTEIRARRAAGEMPAALASAFGVTRVTIHRTVRAAA